MFKLNNDEQIFFKEITEKLITTGFKAMDLEAVSKYYHHNDDLRFCDADGPYHKGWKEYSLWLEKIFDGFAEKQNFKLRDTYSYKLKEDIVITTTFIDNKTKICNGRIIDSAMRLTLVWMKTADEWKIVHEHFSMHTGGLADALGYKDTGKQIVEL